MLFRRNPAVTDKAPQVFDYILQAVDAETIQGQVAERAIAAVKQLLAQSGLSVQQLAAQVPPERHNALKKFL